MRPDGDPTGLWSRDVTDGDDPLARMLDEAPVLRIEEVPALLRRLAPALGAQELIPYVIDYTQRLLVPVADAVTPAREPVEVDTSLAGRCYRDTSVLPSGDDGTHLWAPMLDDSERLGVLEILLEAPADREHQHLLIQVANLLARLIATRSSTGDALQQLRRRRPMTVAAEMQWNLLPPLSLTTRQLTVSGILEPCYDIGGDTFDYAVNDDILHLAVFDAMGHGLDAAQLAVLAIAAYRNARRSGLDLRDTYRCIDKLLAHEYPHRFVTGLLAEMDVSTGALRTINAGHPGALLFRQGHFVKTLPGPTALPMGLREGAVEIEEEKLEPGDAVLMYTDGITEARIEGRQFGIPRLIDFMERELGNHLPAHEAMRRLLRELLDYQDDELQDDASAVLLEWGPQAVESMLPTLPADRRPGATA